MKTPNGCPKQPAPFLLDLLLLDCSLCIIAQVHKHILLIFPVLICICFIYLLSLSPLQFHFPGSILQH